MNDHHYIGFDAHKKTIQYCAKWADGTIHDKGKIRATRQDLERWCSRRPAPWKGALEATMFTGWIYDTLKPHAVEVKAAHPAMLKAITASKHASDELDAEKIADLVRMNWIPGVWMAPPELRDLRLQLRYRNLVLRQATQVKNRIASTLMEHGVQYTKKKLHQRKYFHELMEQLEEVPAMVRSLLQHARGSLDLFAAAQKTLLHQLRVHPLLASRVALLQTIPGIGPVTSLTWALEIGDPHRFPSIADAQSYCGLVAAFQQSAEKVYRQPLSKKRNAHLQSMLIEAAHLVPQHHPALRELYEKVKATNGANVATLEVARKLVAYLMSVDKSGTPFQIRTSASAPAPGSPTGNENAFPPNPPIAKKKQVAQRSSPSRVRSAAAGPQAGAPAAPRTAPGRCAAETPAMGGSGGKAKSSAKRR